MENKITRDSFKPQNKANGQNKEQNYFITMEELKALLRCANNKKSYGKDKIPSIILKYLPEALIAEICTIFNNLLNNRTYPNCWKQARIFPIRKKDKNPANPNNYRPISLLSNLGKIYEIIIYNKIADHTAANKLVPDNQFGFRHNHTTTHAIVNLTSHISRNLNNQTCTGAVLIDSEKAFESVWLDGLIFKLNKTNFEKDVIHILLDMLYNRQFVTTNGTNTSTRVFNVNNGLQQGSVTAPILFNLYTKDIVENEKINNGG